MLTKKAQGVLSGGSIGVAIVLIVFLVFILIYLVAIPEQYREELNITSPVQYSSVVLNEYPGKLYLGNGDVKTETYNYDISTVSLDNTPQKESILLSPQGFIKKSTTSTRILTYDFDVNDINELDRVYLNFNVIDKKGSGDIIVKLNGLTIYSGKSNVNENVEVTLPLYQLKNNNVIKITTSSTGWKFWSTNSYLLSDIYLMENKYSSDHSQAKRIVTIDSKALYDAKDIKLVGYAKKLSSKDEEVTISVNGNVVYSEVPDTLGLDINIPETYLKAGINNIDFSVGRDGKYNLMYLNLQIKTTQVSEENVAKYNFNINSVQWKKVKNTNYICELYIKKSNGDNSVNINLNNNILKYSFDDNNEVIKDVCNYLEFGENTITLTPEDVLNLDEVKLTIKNK